MRQTNEAPAPRQDPLAGDLVQVSGYIRQAGERIRALRARRGMTRKQLSHDSGVSERYLAKAESGNANVSFILLWRITRGLGVHFLELFPDGPDDASHLRPLLDLVRQLSPDQQTDAYALLHRRFVRSRVVSRGVALIGLRGAGKTRLGTLLAQRCNVPFVRLGEVIERLGGMSLDELFSLGGQQAYRRLEHQALEHVLARFPTAVVEAAGSVVSESRTFNLLLDSYFTVWIKASPAEHMERVLAQGDLRPMRGHKEAMHDLKRILVEREADYRAADYTLDTSGRAVDACLAELVARCEQPLAQESVGLR